MFMKKVASCEYLLTIDFTLEHTHTCHCSEDVKEHKKFLMRIMTNFYVNDIIRKRNPSGVTAVTSFLFC